jgi:hypothetical protein
MIRRFPGDDALFCTLLRARMGVYEVSAANMLPVQAAEENRPADTLPFLSGLLERRDFFVNTPVRFPTHTLLIYNDFIDI